MFLRLFPRALTFAVAVAAGLHTAQAESPPLLRPNDVIALVGGEDMVAADEYGYLEFMLTRALPGHQLKFRCLAWEGDTATHQPRQLNYPTVAQQLDEIGATVVIAQFWQMSPFARDLGREGIAQAIESLEKNAHGEKRRVVLLYPTPVEDHPALAGRTEAIAARFSVLRTWLANAAQETGCASIVLDDAFTRYSIRGYTRDGIHLNERGHRIVARLIAAGLLRNAPQSQDNSGFLPVHAELVAEPLAATTEERRLLELIAGKNRLWDRYRRPQNWAFLAGDRTTQPSSRDHRDPSKRWFPEEMKQYLPMIDAKEREIWQAAAQLPQNPQ